MLRGVASLLGQAKAIDTTWVPTPLVNGWRPGQNASGDTGGGAMAH